MRLAPLRPEDRARVSELLIATAAFSSEEVDVALELFDERFNELCRPELSVAPASPFPDYEFVGAYDDQQLLGYACFGATPATEGHVRSGTGSPWTLRRRDMVWAERSCSGSSMNSVAAARDCSSSRRHRDPTTNTRERFTHVAATPKRPVCGISMHRQMIESSSPHASPHERAE